MRIDNSKSYSYLRVKIMDDKPTHVFNVRYRMTVKYIEDKDAEKLGIKNIHNIPLIFMKKDVEDQKQEVVTQSENHDAQADPEQCTEGHDDPFMFVVPPGRHTFVRVLDRKNPIYKGGRILLYSMHVHAYGESVNLLDETTGKAILPNSVPDFTKLVMLKKTNPALYASYSSYLGAGIPIDPSHTYALKTVYDNTGNRPVEGMSLIHLYVAGQD